MPSRGEVSIRLGRADVRRYVGHAAPPSSLTWSQSVGPGPQGFGSTRALRYRSHMRETLRAYADVCSWAMVHMARSCDVLSDGPHGPELRCAQALQADQQRVIQLLLGHATEVVVDFSRGEFGSGGAHLAPPRSKGFVASEPSMKSSRSGACGLANAARYRSTQASAVARSKMKGFRRRQGRPRPTHR